MTNIYDYDSRAFLRNIDMRDQEGCWPWLGAIDRQGYGVVRAKTQPHIYEATGRAYCILKAHRVMASRGRIFDERAVITHTCGNKACCNPIHLRIT